MLQRFFCLLISFSFFLLILPAQAQTKALNDQELAAVMAVIHYLLLDETSGGPIDITLDQTDQESYGYRYGEGNYRDGLEINFSGQSESVVLCFNGVDIQPEEVHVELNGEHIGTLQAGENCFTFTAAQQQANNVLAFIHTNPGERWGINHVGYNLASDAWLTLPLLTRSEWDNLAVRKVLQVFAFGGHATDAQIQLWADMDPEDAIKEMLNFEPHNPKLSPLAPNEKYQQTTSLDGTFWNFREHLSNLSSDLPIDADEDSREEFGVDNYNSQGAWTRMTLARGFNPFRQKIAYWETNYHLAVNLDVAAVTDRQLTYYYDLIMNAHAAGVPYEQVIAAAAKSAAVASQYSHGVRTTSLRADDDNRWVPRRVDVNNTPDNPYDDDLDYDDMYCQCNEDFARELHQLFFGILGEQDPLGLQHHEDVTIPETAKALTDMRVVYDRDNSRWPEVVDFQTRLHFPGTVNVLNTTIAGANAAEKIDAIAAVAINHPESLQNLPVMIISGLADDELSDQKKQQLRAAWAAMPSKNFLEFIQAYAVSELFHAADRVKYFPSIDRFMYIGNKLVLNNTEALSDLYLLGTSWSGSRSYITENTAVFVPLHNVFGGQTGIEASDSAAVMENNYNRFTARASFQVRFNCSSANCAAYADWHKDWASVIPKLGGVYRVEDVAVWLWRHFVGDGGKNYTDVERAHILALLATSRDLNQLYCVQQRRIVENIQPSQGDINNHRTPLELLERDNPYDTVTERRCDNNLDAVGDPVIDAELALLEHGFSTTDLQTAAMTTILDEMANRTLNLDSADQDDRDIANIRIGRAINFILATPFIMAQEAR